MLEPLEAAAACIDKDDLLLTRRPPYTHLFTGTLLSCAYALVLRIKLLSLC